MDAAVGAVDEAVGGKDVKVDMCVVQDLCGNLREHRAAVHVHPFGVGVIEDGRVRSVNAAGQKMRRTAAVNHKLREAFKLRIGTVCAEMRRTVGVGERGRECVRNEIVHAAHEKIVEQPLHHGRTFRPAVCAEDFAHRTSFGLQTDMREGCGKFCENVIEEFRISVVAEAAHRVDVVGHSGDDLVKNDVDAAHVLTVQGTEVVTGTASETGVGVHVFDDVTDVLDAVCFAPVAELTGEAVAVELCHRVHVGVTEKSGVVAETEPQRGQVSGDVIADGFRHHGRDAVVPRQCETGHADAAVVHAVVVGMGAVPVVAERGLIGEEAGDGVSEILFVVCPVRFVDRVDQYADGFFAEHIDVVGLTGASAGLIEEEDTPASCGDGELQEVSGHAVRQRDRLGTAVFAVTGARIGVYAEQDVVVVHRVGGQERIGERPHHVHVAFNELPFAQFGMVFDLTDRVTGGEVVVVEDPDLHSALFGFREDDVHVAPPAVAAEIAVRTGFHAERTASALINAFDFLGDGVGVVAVLPVEGKHIVGFISGQHVIETVVHRNTSGRVKK